MTRARVRATSARPWAAIGAVLFGTVLFHAAQAAAQTDDLPPAVAPQPDDVTDAENVELGEDVDPLLDDELLRELSADSEDEMLDDLGLESEPGAPIAA